MFALAACGTEATLGLPTAQSRLTARSPAAGRLGRGSAEGSVALRALWSLVNLQVVCLEVCLRLHPPRGECDLSTCV